MPTREAIVDQIIPQQVEKPIPVRVVQTRVGPKVTQNIDQRATSDKPAAASAATEESVRLSPQVSALARKEQAYRQRELALKEREKALEEKLAKADRYSQLETGFAAKDYSKAEELGLSYEEYTKYLIDRQAGEDPQGQRFKALEEEIQTLKKGNEEKATREYDETVAMYRDELSQGAESPEFQMVKKFKDKNSETNEEFTGVDVALQFILDSWEKDSKAVSVEEALKLTKDFLVSEANKFAALNEQPESEVEGKQALPPPKTGARTLTQHMQPAGVTKQPVKSLQHLPDDARYAEARRRVLERRAQR